MYHSISFITVDRGENEIGVANTWTDWKLIPASRPLFNPAPVNTEFTNIPGVSGAIDMTGILDNQITYNLRTGSWEFYVMNGYSSWNDRYDQIVQFLHGQRAHCILEDDPLFYYSARLSVNSWKSEKDYSKITIDYTADPYKESNDLTNEQLVAWGWTVGDSEETSSVPRRRSASLPVWNWDDTEFNSDYLIRYGTFNVSGSIIRNVIYSGSVNVVPTITCTSAMTVTIRGNTYNLRIGANRIGALYLKNGSNVMTFNGNGTVTIDYPLEAGI